MTLAALLSREAIVVTAIAGAALATLTGLGPVRARIGDRASSGLVAVGYALTGVSIALMITAGFLSGR